MVIGITCCSIVIIAIGSGIYAAYSIADVMAVSSDVDFTEYEEEDGNN